MDKYNVGDIVKDGEEIGYIHEVQTRYKVFLESGMQVWRCGNQIEPIDTYHEEKSEDKSGEIIEKFYELVEHRHFWLIVLIPCIVLFYVMLFWGGFRSMVHLTWIIGAALLLNMLAQWKQGGVS